MLRVMVADDERPAREMVAALVRATPELTLVAEADCGEQLAERLARETPDVLLLDPALPQLDIVSLASRSDPRPLIVWLCADDDAGALEGGSPEERAAGLAHAQTALVLHKPVLPNELAQAMSEAARQLAGHQSAVARDATGDGASPMWPALQDGGVYVREFRDPRGAEAIRRPERGGTGATPRAATAGTVGVPAPPEAKRRAASAPAARDADRLRGLREVLGLTAAFVAAFYLFTTRGGVTVDADGVLRGVTLSAAERQYQPVSFTTLSGFDYDSASANAIPAAVRGLGGHKVALRGFMLPLDVGPDGVRTFLLNSSYDMCAFGVPTGAPNQWVEVQMAGTKRAPFVHTPLVVLGTLDVGEVRSQGRVVSLYRLVADAAEVPR